MNWFNFVILPVIILLLNDSCCTLSMYVVLSSHQDHTDLGVMKLILKCLLLASMHIPPITRHATRSHNV